jgi:hypothetical protein
MKKYITNIIALLILILLFTACTENGVECSLTGTWNIDEYDIDGFSGDIDDVDGYLKIDYNDTYDAEIDYKRNGTKIEAESNGTLKACSYNKYIQFFSDDDDALYGGRDSVNCRYTLSNNKLTIYNDDFTMELTKTYK